MAAWARIIFLGILPFVFVYIATFVLSNGPVHEDDPALSVFDWMEFIPTQRKFFLSLALILSGYVGWRAYQYYALETALNTPQHASGLPLRDRRVASEFRRRALNLRTRAEVILFGVVALLGGGLYVVLLVLPQVDPRDERLRNARQAQSIFKERFGPRIKLISEGGYWFNVADLEEGENYRTMEFGPEAKYGLIAGDAGSILVTNDGGQSWEPSVGLKLEEGQRIDEVAFGRDGRGLVGSVGSVFVRPHGRKSWHIPIGLELKGHERIIASYLGPDGHGAVVGDRGSVYVTSEGISHWRRPTGLDLENGERIDKAAFSHDGRGLVAGRMGSVFGTRDSGKSWSRAGGLTVEEDDKISGIFFASNGRGMAVTENGSIFMTERPGDSWRQTKSLTLKTEQILAVTSDADGQGVAVSDTGSVFLTKNGRNWKRSRRLGRISAAALATDGHGVAIRHDHVLRTSDHGRNWNSTGGLLRTEFDGDFEVAMGLYGFGLIVGDRGRVFLIQRTESKLGRVDVRDARYHKPIAVLVIDGAGVILNDFVSLAIGTDGNLRRGELLDFDLVDDHVVTSVGELRGPKGLVVGDSGSVLTTSDQGRSWKLSNYPWWDEDERVTAAAFSDTGEHGFITGDRGSIFATSNGGSWDRLERPPLHETEWITASSITQDRKGVLVFGDAGSVFVVSEGGTTLNLSQEFDLEKSERIRAVEIQADGAHGLIIGTNGSGFVTTNGGETWVSDFLLKRLRGDTAWGWDAHGTYGLVAGTDLVVVTRDGGKTWKKLELGDNERIVSVAFGDSGYALAGTSRGSVFETSDGWENWRRSTKVDFGPAETVSVASFTADGLYGLVAGDHGSVFVTRDGGGDWGRTEWDQVPISSIAFIGGLPGGSRPVVSVDRMGSVYLLKEVPEVGELIGLTLDDIRVDMTGMPGFVRTSSIGQEISEFLDVVAAYSRESGDNALGDVENSRISGLLGELTVHRTVVLIILFFLVRLLVQLYQYDMRLSAFWEARADALVLAETFSQSGTDSFDALVTVMAPDGYDFKPPPKPMSTEVRLPRSS